MLKTFKVFHDLKCFSDGSLLLNASFKGINVSKNINFSKSDFKRFQMESTQKSILNLTDSGNIKYRKKYFWLKTQKTI